MPIDRVRLNWSELGPFSQLLVSTVVMAALAGLAGLAGLAVMVNEVRK